MAKAIKWLIDLSKNIKGITEGKGLKLTTSLKQGKELVVTNSICIAKKWLLLLTN